MRLAPPHLLLVALAAVAACREPPPARAPADPSPPQLAPQLPPQVEIAGWTAHSHDRAFQARQSSQAGGCALEVGGPGRPSWSAAACVATPGDRVFVAPDGERLMVLTPLPEHAGADWSELVVVTLLQRERVVRRIAAVELLGPALAADMSRHYSWLQGLALGADPATGARYAPGGAAVELETVGGRTFTVGFDGAGLPPPRSAEELAGAARERREAAQAARDAADTRVYRWEDAQGAAHFGRVARIPAALRSRAVPVEADRAR